VPFIGSFDERFLEIPEEVLITSMKKNQKYFAVRSKEGKLMNSFVGVANNRAVDMRGTSVFCALGSKTPRFSGRRTVNSP